MKVSAIIPARYGSNRLPGKPLKQIAGKPMIEHVYRRSKEAKSLDQVIVATDHPKIYQTVQEFGGQARMTSESHQTGTDRLAEVAENLESKLIVNVQGDEPLIRPKMIDQAVKPLLNDNKIKMGTLKHQITEKEEIKNPNNVKVVTDQDDFALYFSRLPIPYSQGDFAVDYYQHIGLYVYKREFLLNYTNWETTSLEEKENLEQLRVLENGYRIKVVETEEKLFGVDTLEDLERVRRMYKKNCFSI